MLAMPHMRLCRDKDSCIYKKTNSCELINENITEERQAQIDLLMKENKELKEEITKKNFQIETLSNDVVKILKRVDALEQKESEKISLLSYLELKEIVDIPHEKVPFQFMFQDKNATNVFNNPYQCDDCDKVFDKNPKLKNHIDDDHAYCLVCEKVIQRKSP